ncbi:MAG TPA: ACP S-malonyltransferase [Oscillospiraceae bacterium]|nr:ACP S-malonyltransferase [Oscillospiraceae bacterium]HRW56652.1 ACP S-malonyltransferase [Oscillospiraceae bacterium]
MDQIAFVFAGQGAQTVGMGKDLYERFGSAREVFDLAGEQIKTLCFEGPAEELNRTVRTQPCLFAMDLACARVLEENGAHAGGAAGFSLGEIPALAYAGLMSDREAYDFVCLRAEAMQRCAEKHPGAMLAVLRLSAAEVERICGGIPETYPVNYNCEGQTVVACALESVEPLQEAVAAAGGKCIRLAVGGAFHSPFMEEAAGEITRYLKDKTFGEPHIPLYSNVTAERYGDPGKLLSLQAKSPVLWQKTVETMISDGFDTFIEVGPGKTLSGLIRKISGSVRVLHVSDMASLEETLTEVAHA